MNKKKLFLEAENFYYRLRYGKEVNIDDYRFGDSRFSGKRLNVIFLSYSCSTFGMYNRVEPLREMGEVYWFLMTQDPEIKDWYAIKERRNSEMYDFVSKTISEHEIDVIVCYLSGRSTDPKTLEKIRAFGIPMINEGLDDERKFRSRRGEDGVYRGNKSICKYFDLSLTSSKSAIVKYLVEGGRPMYKDYAGNEKKYKNLPLDKTYDVAFVGSDYGVRRKYIQHLRENGIDVYTKGNGWEEGFADSDEMVEIFNRAKIVLGFSTVGKNDDIFILKGRDFEVPLTGSFYLTGFHDELFEYFDIGRDIEVYRSKEELLDKVRYYLENEDQREEIAVHGYNKSVSKYTAVKAYERVFGYLNL
ncbi:MAG: glycosyltransferase [Candidatus Sedimenticola sp. (ex Thyasira tokunagai)]